MTSKEMENMIMEIVEIFRSRFFGKYRGVVKTLGEGENLGCIQAQVPEVFGEEQLSPWASPMVPFAGPKYGFIVLPQLDDGVWIEFEGGDISRPVWTGYWWAKGEEVPDNADAETRLIVTPIGHKIILDDRNNEMKLLHSEGAEFKLSSDEILLKIGSSQITIKSEEVNINNGSLVVR
ncbi:MAG: phage baseplate assembly protein V [Candidatus Thorarchaeota archaeon]